MLIDAASILSLILNEPDLGRKIYGKEKKHSQARMCAITVIRFLFFFN
jgi:hypothetical protein